MMKSNVEIVETVSKSVLGLNGSDLNSSVLVAFCPLMSRIVCPSGAALATIDAALIPPGPGMFSTTNACPIDAAIFCVTARTTMSPSPPGPNPTTTFTCLEG